MRILVVVLASALTLGCAGLRGSGPDIDIARAQVELAAQLAARRDWGAAVSALEHLPRDRTLRASALIIRGTALRERGMYEEAESDFREALQLAPKEAAAHSGLALTADLRRSWALALEHHERAAKLAPENAGYLNNWAFALFAAGRARDAIPVYERALRVTPTDRRLHNNLAFALAQVGDYRRAARHFESGGSFAEARNNLGFAYERAGNLVQAFDAYREACRADPALTKARENLVHVAQLLQRELPVEARDHEKSEEVR
ncbi:MAG TPA: tetratricopeptide repeat protein [Anaeromyxobacter sp.]|jgi:Flp pilus assembly protein TadD|nr:tetratricopeptide repeat protein [Anaeromyxobacter sp.]